MPIPEDLKVRGGRHGEFWVNVQTSRRCAAQVGELDELSRDKSAKSWLALKVENMRQKDVEDLKGWEKLFYGSLFTVTKAAVKSIETTGYEGAIRPYSPCKIRHGARAPITSL